MLIGIVLMVWAYWTDALGTSGVQSVSGQMLPTLNEVSIMDDLLILLASTRLHAAKTSAVYARRDSGPHKTFDD